MGNDLIKIGNKLRAIRKQIGLSRREVFEKYKIPSNTLKSWENGLKEIGIMNLINYLKTFEDYGVYIDFNSILGSENNIASIFHDYNKAHKISAYLMKLESSNALFYTEPSGLILFFNSRYKNFLNIEKEEHNLSFLNLRNIFSPYEIKEILTIASPNKNIRLTQPIFDSKIQLQLELYSNYDIYDRIIGILGILSPALTINHEIK